MNSQKCQNLASSLLSESESRFQIDNNITKQMNSFKSMIVVVYSNLQRTTIPDPLTVIEVNIIVSSRNWKSDLILSSNVTFSSKKLARTSQSHRLRGRGHRSRS